MRKAKIERNTKETQVYGELFLEGKGNFIGETGLGFLDHMLTLFCFHGGFDLRLTVKGDLAVDSHHTMEDIGIVLGQLFREALGNKEGIARYGSFTIPMDEALMSTYVDFSGRGILVYSIEFTREFLGDCATEDFKEFFQGFVREGKITLHILEHYGENNHHKIEGVFKSLGRSLKQATEIVGSGVTSTKGIL